jgi:hypothetical protein
LKTKEKITKRTHTTLLKGSTAPELRSFDEVLTKTEQRLLARLSTPNKIQLFLNDLAYSSEVVYRCPLRVLRQRTCQCFDGALFGAAMLRRLGHPALILNLLPNDRDDDHVLALFKHRGHWGAVAKSNFVGLRFREPICRTLRELVLSYFEQYYNVAGEKTLRGYTLPLNLKTFDRLHWMTKDETMEQIAQRLDEIRRVLFLTRPMIAQLSLVDKRSRQAGLLGANKAGLYQPPRRRHSSG